MHPIVIFRCAPSEGPGYFAEFLDRHEIPHRLVRVDCADPVPHSLDEVSGLVCMGGPMSVNDDLPWIPKVTRLIRDAVAADLPVLGHCLGGQLMSKALGGIVTRNPVKEIGWLPVHAAENGPARDWLDGLPATFDVYHWHGEIFSIPKNAVRILSSAHCANQAFVIGNSLGLQCHVEMTASLVHVWLQEANGKLKPSATVQTPTEQTTDLAARVARLHRVADTLYTRWIAGLKRTA